VFDPAVYYGDRECDLAMTELFGGFSPDFYAAYNHVYPLDSGYKQRKILYNLYHILNHANLFGSAYIMQSKAMMQQLIKQAS
jgi:fructosamine-3-kinase